VVGGLMLLMGIGAENAFLILLGIGAGIGSIIGLIGLFTVSPNEAKVLQLFGNYIGTVRPNYFVGIRTPWTLESDDVWRATHRNCGRILVFGSLAFLVLQLLVEQAYMLPCYFGFVAATGLWSVLYSYWRFRSSHPPGPTPGRHSD